jgi:hypothetical protein
MARTNVADESGVRVMADRCSTCIFRPGNLMDLQAGRVKDMLATIEQTQGCIPCHQTLDDEKQAVCRGQYEALRTQPLQLAERMGMIVEWPP